MDAKLALTAVDETRAAFQSAARNLDNFKNRVDAAGRSLKTALVGAVSGISAGALAKELTERAIEAEQANARLGAVLRATGHAAGVSAKEIDELSEALAQSTQFDDEGIKNAAAQLLVFKNVQGDTFREALKLSADVAAFFGEDVPAAAAKLGRSLEDPETAFGLLRRAGILLSEQQKDQIKEMAELGNVAGAQAIIIEKLKGAFEGTAEQLNTGMTKATRDAKKALDEFFEAVGRSEAVGGTLQTTLGGLTQILREMKAVVEGSPGGFRNYASSIVELTGEIASKVNPVLGNTLKLLGQVTRRGAEAAPEFSVAELGEARLEQDARLARAAADQRAEQEREAAYVRAKKAREEAAKAAKAAASEAAREAKADLERFRNAKLALEEQAASVEELTEFEKTRFAIEQGRLGTTAQANRDELLAAAARVDQLREEKRVRDEVRVAIDQQNQADNEALIRNAEERKRARDSIIALIDPVQKYRVELEKVREALAKGDISPEIALEAEFRIQEQIDELVNLQEEVKKTKGIGEELGHTFTSAFEDAVVEGKAFSDVLKGLEKDIVRIVTRKLVTEPAGEAIADFAKNSLKDIFSSGGGGSSAGGGGISSALGGAVDFFKNLLGFQHGGTFTVGGAGGSDSQLVAFRATPGERVDVTPQGGAVGRTVNVYLTANGDMSRETALQAGRRVGEAVQTAMRRGA